MKQKEVSNGKMPLKLALWGLVVLCLGLVVVAYFFVGLVLTLGMLLILVLVVAFAASTSFSDALLSTGPRVLSLIASVLGLVGGVIAFWSALSAFQAGGADPAYSDRLWAVWAALLLPIVAAVATLF